MRISDWSSDVCSSDLLSADQVIRYRRALGPDRQYHQQQDQEDNPQPEQPPRKLAVLLGPRRRRFVLHFNRHAGHGLSLRFQTCLRRTALPWAEYRFAPRYYPSPKQTFRGHTAESRMGKKWI